MKRWCEGGRGVKEGRDNIQGQGRVENRKQPARAYMVKMGRLGWGAGLGSGHWNSKSMGKQVS